MKTCCSLDCPNTHNKIIRQLCGIYYPYGGKSKCNKHFKKWLETEKEVQQLHQQYLEEENR